MLRRAAQSLRQAYSSHSTTASLWKDLETVASSKRIIHNTPFRQAAAEAAPAPTPSGSASGLASVPALIKALGFGGALPFWIFSPPVASHLPLHLLGDGVAEKAGALQVSYGATIISFLGGVHWGLAMTSLTPLKLTGQRYIWSVIPCLAVWPTLVLPQEHAAALQAALLGFVYIVDRGWLKRGGLPPWYMALRLPLTVLAAAGLSMTAVAGGGAVGVNEVAAVDDDEDEETR